MPKSRTLGQKILYFITTILLLLIMVIIVGEIGLRLVYVLKNINVEAPKPPYNTAEKEDKIGWLPKSNYLFDGKMKDRNDVEYDVYLTTSENGFRQYGNPNSDKTKVFFLGDSYTQSVEVGDDKTFYKILGDSLPIEVFAFGMAGYGQLQQYMILEEYYDKIQPDILVLQVCSNDFIDNHYQLEMESGYQVGLRRPYLTINNTIEYHHPEITWKNVEKYSRFLGFVLRKFRNVQQKTGIATFAEAKIAEQGRTYEAFDYSVSVTDVLIQKMAEKCGQQTKIIVFNADTYEPQQSEFKEICTNHEMIYTLNPANAIQEQKPQEVVFAQDGYHWNEKGHEVIAKALMENLKMLLK